MVMIMSLDETWLWANEADPIALPLTRKHLSLVGVESLSKGQGRAQVGAIH
jgi:hypothetical protein